MGLAERQARTLAGSKEGRRSLDAHPSKVGIIEDGPRPLASEWHFARGDGQICRRNSPERDDNPTVVASALASLMDIWERSDTIKLTIDYSNASKMVAILPDCSE